MGTGQSQVAPIALPEAGDCEEGLGRRLSIAEQLGDLEEWEIEAHQVSGALVVCLRFSLLIFTSLQGEHVLPFRTLVVK